MPGRPARVDEPVSERGDHESHARWRWTLRPAGYLLLALTWAWPLPLHMGSRLSPDPGDPLLITYLFWWNAHSVPFTASWWNAPFFWPMTDALALTEHFAGLSPITTPIQLLGGSPIVAYNVILIGSTWWSGLATDALVRRLTGSAVAAACAGVAFALAPYRTSQLGHMQLYACWWLPLALLALHSYVETGRRRWLVVFGVSWLLQALTNGYLLLFFPLLLVAWIGWFTPWRSHPRRGLAILATWFAFSLPLIPVLLEYLRVQTTLGLERNRAEMIFFSASWSSFVAATPMLRFWHTSIPPTTEGFLFPGVTVVCLVVLGLAARLRSKAFVFYLAAALVTAWLCFGPAEIPSSTTLLWHPYEWLMRMPGFSGLRVPARFYLLTCLCLSIAAGLALARVQAAFGRRRVLGGLVFAGLIVDGAIAGMPLVVPPGRLAYVERGGRLLSLPFDDLRWTIRTMYQSMPDRLTVVNGYAGYVPPHANVISWALARHDDTILTELRRGRPLYVVVATSEEAVEWTRFIESQSGVERLGISGGGLVFKLSAGAYAPIVRPGPRLDVRNSQRTPEWLTLDLAEIASVRTLELKSFGHVGDLPISLRVETSTDGQTWTLAHDERPGGAALLGALSDPRRIPLRLLLSGALVRYIRVNTPFLDADAVSLYAP
jgi:hypothetical protein